jgi:hypothetical protein
VARRDDLGDAHRLRAAVAETGGLGLVSMRERLRQVGGELTVTSKPAHGTTIAAGVPLVRDRQVIAANRPPYHRTPNVMGKYEAFALQPPEQFVTVDDGRVEAVELMVGPHT